jgi:hypothetical protein
MLKKFRLWNFALTEIIKHDHSSHSSEEFGINIEIILSTEYKTTVDSEKNAYILKKVFVKKN